LRFAVVRSLFNADITAALVAGATRAFAEEGIAAGDLDVFEVPGAFELPLCSLWLANSARYDAIVCLGCVIRGETAHFEYVAGEAARGISDVALRTGVPIIFGVLTTDTLAQAWQRAADPSHGTPDHASRPDAGSARSDGARGNKGYEAARSALHMAGLRSKVPK
jgi:6,7-dimethyl-8-ribityllumazine synthase